MSPGTGPFWKEKRKISKRSSANFPYKIKKIAFGACFWCKCIVTSPFDDEKYYFWYIGYLAKNCNFVEPIITGIIIGDICIATPNLLCMCYHVSIEWSFILSSRIAPLKQSYFRTTVLEAFFPVHDLLLPPIKEEVWMTFSFSLSYLLIFKRLANKPLKCV